MLTITDVQSINGKEILKGLNLKSAPERSTRSWGQMALGNRHLRKFLQGILPMKYCKGKLHLKGIIFWSSILRERAHLGLFMSFQYPPEIPGITNLQFLHAAHNAQRKAKNLTPIAKRFFQSCSMKRWRQLALISSLNKGL